jgi:hypothetical protein
MTFVCLHPLSCGCPACNQRRGALLPRPIHREEDEAVRRDAARYRAFRYIAYTLRDESFDAYDEDGLDAELDRRIAENPRIAL